MILTVTPTPKLDRLALAETPVHNGSSIQLQDVTTLPAGAGTNITHTLFKAGVDSKAIFPAPEISHYMRLVTMLGIPHDFIPAPGPIPLHFSVVSKTEGQEVVTDFMDPPMPLDPMQLAMLRDLTVSLAEESNLVVLAGELPNIANSAWYVDVIRTLRLYHPQIKIGVTSSGSALQAVIRQVAITHPNFLAARFEEFVPKGQELTLDNALIEARSLVDAGVGEVLLFKGRSEAYLVSSDGTLRGTATSDALTAMGVHWTDAALAGYLLATRASASKEESLRMALAYANVTPLASEDFVPTPDLVENQVVEISQL